MAITLARPSVASLLLQPRSVTGVVLGSATGFVVERDGRKYLVTNWHVVSGKRADNGATISGTGAVPSDVGIFHNVAGALGSWSPKVEALYTPAGAPRWREHAAFGRSVDVVALELTQLDGVATYPYDPWSAGPGLMISVASGLSIVGFPFGLTGGGALAIWVRGWIATEPTADFNQRPSFLVDSRTRPGQSGAPVILYETGGAVAMADGGTLISSGPMEQFLGVYSGRVNDHSDLGFVWKASAVRDIVDAGVAGAV